MARQWSATLRNALRDVYVSAFPAGTVIDIRTGGPAGVSNSAGGTLLAQVTTPATPFNTATGQVTKNGTWQDASINASGTAGHYRAVSGSNIEEGTIGLAGSGADMIVSSTTFVAGEPFDITAWTITMPGA